MDIVLGSRTIVVILRPISSFRILLAVTFIVEMIHCEYGHNNHSSTCRRRCFGLLNQYPLDGKQFEKFQRLKVAQVETHRNLKETGAGQTTISAVHAGPTYDLFMLFIRRTGV